MAGYKNQSNGSNSGGSNVSGSGSLGGRGVYSNSSINMSNYNTNSNSETVDLNLNYESDSFDQKWLDQYFSEKGDINGDGVVDSKDVELLRQEITNDSLDVYHDLNGDNITTVADIALLQKYINGEEIKFNMIENYEDFLLQEYRPLEMEYFGFLDYNHDNVIDINDANAYYDLYKPKNYDESKNPVLYYLNNYRNKIYPQLSYESHVDEVMSQYADYNKDGIVDMTDATQFQRDLNNGVDIDYKFDLDGDGTISEYDYEIIQKYLNGEDVVKLIDRDKFESVLVDYKKNFYEDVVNVLNFAQTNFEDAYQNRKTSDEIMAERRAELDEEEAKTGEHQEDSLSDYTDYTQAVTDEYFGFKHKMEYLSKDMTDRLAELDSKKDYYDETMKMRFDNPYEAGLRDSFDSAEQLKYTMLRKQEFYSGSELEDVKADAAFATSYCNQVETKLGLAPYEKYIGKVDYLEYKKNYDKSAAPDGDILATVEKDFDGDIDKMKEWIKNRPGTTERFLYEYPITFSVPVAGFFIKDNEDAYYQAVVCWVNMTEEQRMLYHYVYYKDGPEAATNYMNLLVPELNQKQGGTQAMEYINTLNRTDVDFEGYMLQHGDANGDGQLTDEDLKILQDKPANSDTKYDISGDGVFNEEDVEYLRQYLAGNGDEVEKAIDYNPVSSDAYNFISVAFKGYEGGLEGFLEGVENSIYNNETLTPDQYEKLIILQYLALKNPSLERTYKISSSIGNMTIPILVSIVVSTATDNPQLGQFIASILMGVSAYGNGKQQSLVKGNSLFASVCYGIANGTSEALSEYLLGGINYISKGGKATLLAILKEAMQEGLQEYMDAGYRAVILGETIDLGELNKEALDSVINGAIVAVLMNGGSGMIDVTIEGVKYKIDGGKLTAFVAEKGKSITIEDILGIAVVDTKVEQFAKQNNYTLEEASAIYGVLSSHDESVRATAVAKLSNENVVKLLNHLNKNNDVDTYNQVLIQLTSEQLFDLYTSSALTDVQKAQIKSDIDGLRKKIGDENFVADFNKVDANTTVDVENVAQNLVDSFRNSSTIDMSVLDGYNIRTKNSILIKMMSKFSASERIDFIKTLGKSYGISDANLDSFCGYIPGDIGFGIKGVYDDQVINYLNTHGLADNEENRQIALEELVSDKISDAEVSDYRNRNPDLSSKITDDEIKHTIAQNLISAKTTDVPAAAAITLMEYKRRFDEGYYADGVTLDQVFTEKVKCKSDPNYVPKYKDYGKDGKYNHYFPKADGFISDKAVIKYMKSIVSSDSEALTNEFQGLNTIDEMGAFLEKHSGQMYIEGCTFQTAEDGGSNLIKFKDIGVGDWNNKPPHGTNNIKGGMFVVSSSDFESSSSMYSDIFEIDDAGNMHIYDMAAFGNEVLSGVPLSNVDGAIMIKVKVPLNGNANLNIAMPSAANKSAYGSYFVSGGELGSQNHEFVLSHAQLTEAEAQEISKTIKSGGTYTYKGDNGVTYEISMLKTESK